MIARLIHWNGTKFGDFAIDVAEDYTPDAMVLYVAAENRPTSVFVRTPGARYQQDGVGLVQEYREGSLYAVEDPRSDAKK